MGYIREDNQTEIPQDFWRDDLDERPVIVSIRCITYNHEKYIRDALEGFVNQKTDFRFEAIVHDDASTDGTAAIIQEYSEKYPSIIKPIYEKENQYSKRDGSLRKVMDAHTRGKYIAICEGDDYWIDPLKLQKQVDFLERNPDYGMCHTDIRALFQETNECRDFHQPNCNHEDVFANILLNNTYRIITCTVVVRRSIYEEIKSKDKILFGSGHFLMGDTPTWCELVQASKIKSMDKISAVYRVSRNSACRRTDLRDWHTFLLSSNEMRIYLYKKYGLEVPKIIGSKYNKHYFICLCLNSKLKPFYKLSSFYAIIWNIIEFCRMRRPVELFLRKYLKNPSEMEMSI